jgi:hypothetical protein
VYLCVWPNLKIADKELAMSRSRYKKEHVKIANATSRAGGAVGYDAIVPQYVIGHADKKHSILDYGAGKDAIHVDMLKDNGFRHVTAYEFGQNVVPNIHDPEALEYHYDVVFASNVLNVQSDLPMLKKTIGQILGASWPRKGSMIILNYPAEPRKLDASGPKVLDLVQSMAKSYDLELLEGGKSSPVILLTRK